MEKVPNPKKTNFSATENETLISFIEQNTDLIYPISRTTTDAAERQRMWLKLAKKLNRTRKLYFLFAQIPIFCIQKLKTFILSF